MNDTKNRLPLSRWLAGTISAMIIAPLSIVLLSVISMLFSGTGAEHEITSNDVFGLVGLTYFATIPIQLIVVVLLALAAIPYPNLIWWGNKLHWAVIGLFCGAIIGAWISIEAFANPQDWTTDSDVVLFFTCGGALIGGLSSLIFMIVARR